MAIKKDSSPRNGKFVRFEYYIPDYEHIGDLHSETYRIEQDYGGKLVDYEETYDRDYDEDYGDDPEPECTAIYDIPEENAISFEKRLGASAYRRDDAERLRELKEHEKSVATRNSASKTSPKTETKNSPMKVSKSGMSLSDKRREYRNSRKEKGLVAG